VTAWVLIGIVVLIAGFALRFNPLLVVMGAALATGFAAHMSVIETLKAFGHAFNTNRYVTIIYIVLPVIGILERHGLQERARHLIGRMRGATVGRLLIGYLLFRQLTAALGLTSIAGPAQTVRPLVGPMALAAADAQAPDRDKEDETVPAMAAATDNVGLFFGEDIFIAIGSILLMKGAMESYDIMLEPFQLSVWAIPTAVAAFVIHGFRLLLLDRKLGRRR
jgi:uncharacterized membrane protein